jgi:hypothetical protein
MFDLTNVQAQSFDVLPAGEYNVALVSAELKDTKNGGQAIKSAFTVTDGEHQGRKLFHNFNVKNQSEKAQTIGLQQLKSMMTAAGWTDFKLDSVTKLEGIRVVVKTKIEKQEGYDDQARIVAFKAPGKTLPADGIPF